MWRVVLHSLSGEYPVFVTPDERRSARSSYEGHTELHEAVADIHSGACEERLPSRVRRVLDRSVKLHCDLAGVATRVRGVGSRNLLETNALKLHALWSQLRSSRKTRRVHVPRIGGETRVTALDGQLRS